MRSPVQTEVILGPELDGGAAPRPVPTVRSEALPSALLIYLSILLLQAPCSVALPVLDQTEASIHPELLHQVYWDFSPLPLGSSVCAQVRQRLHPIETPGHFRVPSSSVPKLACQPTSLLLPALPPSLLPLHKYLFNISESGEGRTKPGGSRTTPTTTGNFQEHLFVTPQVILEATLWPPGLSDVRQDRLLQGTWFLATGQVLRYLLLFADGLCLVLHVSTPTTPGDRYDYLPDTPLMRDLTSPTRSESHTANAAGGLPPAAPSWALCWLLGREGHSREKGLVPGEQETRRLARSAALPQGTLPSPNPSSPSSELFTVCKQGLQAGYY